MANIFQKSFWFVEKRSVDAPDSEYGDYANYAALKKLREVFGLNVLGNISVDENTMQKVPTFLACLDLVSRSYASLPLRVYKRTKKGAEIDSENELDYVLNIRPNKHQTPFVFKRTMKIHQLLYGWGVAKIVRNIYREVEELIILDPHSYTIYMTPIQEESRSYYIVTKQGKVYQEDDLVIWKGFSVDGFDCKGILGPLKPVITTGLITREFINKYYQNGTFIGGVLTSEASMTPDQRDANKKSWQDAHGGSKNAGKVAVLSGGLKFQPIANTLVDSQLVEFLQQDESAFYKVFGVLPHLVGDTTKATSFGSGIEHMSIGFVRYTLMPDVKQLEEEIGYKCFTRKEQKKYYVKHSLNSLERADYKTRMEGYALGINNGLFSPDDARTLEEMQTYEGGDTYMVNGNMIPVADVGKQYKDNGTGTQTTPV